MRWPVAIALLFAAASEAAVRPLVLGDSQSEEYAFEFPFSAPDSSPLVANTRNWIEILADRRPADLDFGGYEPVLLSYLDLRNAGYASNFGIPGAELGTWRDIAEATFSDLEFWLTRQAVLSQLQDTDGAGNFTTRVVVIFLGGNDVNSDYGDLYNDAPRSGFVTTLGNYLTTILDFIRDARPSVPLVFVNVPDVGATPDIQFDHPDPLKRAVASGHIAALNTRLSEIATSYGAVVVDLFALTGQIIDPAPLYLGTTELIEAGAPENPPDHLFCKDGFHPSTVAQALIANAIVEGINAALGESVAPMPGREILADVLGLDPDQAYYDWLASFPGASLDMTADDDRDGLPQIGEFALQGNPLQPGDLPTPVGNGNGPTITFTLDELASRLVDTIPEQSTDLKAWSPVPPSALTLLPGGRTQVPLPSGLQGQLRLRFLLRP